MRILHHFLPGLDLSPETLRSIASGLEDELPDHVLASAPCDAYSTVDNGRALQGTRQPDVEGANEDISLLNNTMGCLMVDSLGKYSQRFRLPVYAAISNKSAGY